MQRLHRILASALVVGMLGLVALPGASAATTAVNVCVPGVLCGNLVSVPGGPDCVVTAPHAHPRCNGRPVARAE